MIYDKKDNLYSKNILNISSIFFFNWPTIKNKLNAIKESCESEVSKEIDKHIDEIDKARVPSTFNNQEYYEKIIKDSDYKKLVDCLCQKIDEFVIKGSDKELEEFSSIRSLSKVLNNISNILDNNSFICKSVDVERDGFVRSIFSKQDEFFLLTENVCKELLHVIKAPDPMFIIRRLFDRKRVGILSKKNLDHLVGASLALINTKMRGQEQFIFGKVKISSGIKLQHIDEVNADYIDGVSYLKYINEHGFYFHKLDAIDVHLPEKVNFPLNNSKFSIVELSPENDREMQEFLDYASPDNLSLITDEELISYCKEFADKNMEEISGSSSKSYFICEELSRRGIKIGDDIMSKITSMSKSLSEDISYEMPNFLFVSKNGFWDKNYSIVDSLTNNRDINVIKSTTENVFNQDFSSNISMVVCEEEDFGTVNFIDSDSFLVYNCPSNLTLDGYEFKQEVIEGSVCAFLCKGSV